MDLNKSWKKIRENYFKLLQQIAHLLKMSSFISNCLVGPDMPGLHPLYLFDIYESCSACSFGGSDLVSGSLVCLASRAASQCQCSLGCVRYFAYSI
jgi:hypothetical protein